MIGVVADSPVASAAFASTMGWVLRAVSPHRLLCYMNFGLSSQCHPTGTGGSTPQCVNTIAVLAVGSWSVVLSPWCGPACSIAAAVPWVSSSD